MTVRVFVLDDHELTRMGVRTAIAAEPDMVVVGEAAGADEALALILEVSPDVAVIDLQLAQGDGIEVCRHVTAEFPGVRCVVLSAFLHERAVLGAQQAGAAAYVLKQRAGRDLVDAIRRVMRGDTLFDIDIDLTDATEAPDVDPRLHRLSPQERRILALVAEGRTNRQIGAALFLAEKTVKNYVSRLLAKLEMARRSEAAAFGARLAEQGKFRPPTWRPGADGDFRP